MPASWLRRNSPRASRGIRTVCMHSQLFPALAPADLEPMQQPSLSLAGWVGACGCWQRAGFGHATAWPPLAFNTQHASILFDLGGVLKRARSAAKKFLRRYEVTYENNAERNLKILRRNNMDINMPK